MRTVLLALLLSSIGLLASQEQTNAPPQPRDPTLLTSRTNVPMSASTSNQLEQLRSLTPEERRLKIEELRAMHAARGTNPVVSGPSLQQRIARVRALTEEMRRKNEAGSLTPIQQRELANMEKVLKRLEEQNGKGPGNAPTNAP